MKLELARVGLHRNGLPLTKKDLEDAVKNFKDTRPVAIGHIKTGNEPKYGDVKTLEINNDVLIGDVDLHQDAEKLYNDGKFNKWSSGFKKNSQIGTYFHHLALLGAEPPAIEGLKQVAFSDVECDVFTETNYKTESNTDKTFSDDNKGGKNNMNELEEAKKKIAELEEEKKKSEEQLKNFSDELGAVRAEKIKVKRDDLEKSLQGKLPKEQIDIVLGFSDKIEADKSYDFSDNKKRDYYEMMKNVFENIPQMVQEGAQDFSDNSGSENDIDVNAFIKAM